MISIQECNDNLDDIAKKHIDFIFDSINPIIDFYIEVYRIKSELKIGTHKSTINKQIDSIENVHGNGKISLLSKLFIDKKNIKKLEDSWRLKDDSKLLDEAKSTDAIIIALNLLKTDLRNILSINLNKIYAFSNIEYQHYRRNLSPLGFIYKSIFNYDWFISLDESSDWSAYHLTEALGVNVCPYCNRQRTFTVIKGKQKVTRPELDHFLPKHIHPILSLNFYNLVPSCTVCNRDLKGKIGFDYNTHLSPYEENENHEFLKFDYTPNTYEGAVGMNDEITISVKPSEDLSDELLTKVNGNISVFKYDDMSFHLRDMAQEIILKRHISNDEYIKILKTTFPDANLTFNEAYKIAYGNYFDEKDFSKRPLSKLTKDIAINLGALKKFEE